MHRLNIILQNKGWGGLYSMAYILLIEDDPFVADIYVTKFTEVGLTIDLARDGKEGLEKIKEKKPDLVLLDILLPKLGGLELLKIMKKDLKFKNIPVILLSNLGQKEDVKKGLELGASDYIIKANFTPTEMVNRVKDLLKAE